MPPSAKAAKYNRHARYSKRTRELDSPAPSSPFQLPTPLPDEPQSPHPSDVDALPPEAVAPGIFDERLIDYEESDRMLTAPASPRFAEEVSSYNDAPWEQPVLRLWEDGTADYARSIHESTMLAASPSATAPLQVSLYGSPAQDPTNLPNAQSAVVGPTPYTSPSYDPQDVQSEPPALWLSDDGMRSSRLESVLSSPTAPLEASLPGSPDAPAPRLLDEEKASAQELGTQAASAPSPRSEPSPSRGPQDARLEPAALRLSAGGRRSRFRPRVPTTTQASPETNASAPQICDEERNGHVQESAPPSAGAVCLTPEASPSFESQDVLAVQPGRPTPGRRASVRSRALLQEPTTLTSAPSPAGLGLTPGASPVPGSRDALANQLEPPALRVWDEERRGHVRSPVLAREPTMLESFSRTLRTYIPSSIPIPSATPSPPLVSRPVFFGSFTNTNPRPSSIGSLDDNEDSTSPYSSGLAQAFSRNTDPSTTYPHPSAHTKSDPVLWARWDTLPGPRRTLMIGYESGLQLWDCSDLNGVVEVLNLNASEEWGSSRVVWAGMLRGAAGEEGPFLGIVTTNSDIQVFVYSLYRHHVVGRFNVGGAGAGGVGDVKVGEGVVIISTLTPPTLHIISTTTFKVLHTVPAAALAPFTHKYSPPSNDSNNSTNSVSVLLTPRPIFALSKRLLAYASPQPTHGAGSTAQSRRLSTPSSSAASSAGSSSPFGGIGTLGGMTQAELGNAAMKVGGSMLSGMKMIGGMAYSAAKTRVAVAVAAGKEEGGKVYSRSAPTAAGHHEEEVEEQGAERRWERRYSSISSGEGRVRGEEAVQGVSDDGCFVTVVDMKGVLSGQGAPPVVVAEFLVSKREPVSGLRFSSNGCGLMVWTREGQVGTVFALRPAPGVVSRGVAGDGVEKGKASSAGPDVAPSMPSPARVYDLRRGRTTGVVEGVDWTEDGRWAAIGTRKRTIHVFAMNPYGGRPDLRSHMEGRVRNADELMPSTEIGPLVRLRAVKTPAPDHIKVPLAFIFIKSTESTLPAGLRPSATPPPAITGGLPSSYESSSPPLSPDHLHRGNFQDLLVFDPTDGMLSLRRIELDVKAREQGISVPASVSSALGTGSMSIAVPGGGRLSSSPSSAGTSVGGGRRSSGSRPSGLSQMMELPMELVGRDSMVATWHVQRKRGWEEVRRPLEEPVAGGAHRHAKASSFIAQAELSTCSRSSRVLLRSVYLSHQFSFYTLGEDYHALIRRYQFDIGGFKIDVRKEVEVSAFSAGVGSGESFVEGFSSLPRDVRRVSSSFDEPLALALSAGLDYSNPPPAILPMLPNGMPGSKPKAFRHSIPIRSTMAGFGDGMSEGLGRIRREIHNARSPKLLPRTDSSMSGPVPLEFDEEDEDFLSRDVHELVVPDGGSDSHSGSLSTPAMSLHPLDGMDEVRVEDGEMVIGEEERRDEEGDTWIGWDSEDRKMVEEIEGFDDISAVGLLDEEQVQQQQPVMQSAAGRRRGKGGRRM